MGSGENSPAVDDAPIELPCVPELPAQRGRGALTSALPAVGGLGAVGFLAFAPRSPFIYAAGGLIVLVAIGAVAMTVTSARRDRRDSRHEIRLRFLGELDAVRAALRELGAWRRASTSSAKCFDGALHLPVATVPARHHFAEATAPPKADPFCARRLEQFVERRSLIGPIPATIAIGAGTTIGADVAIGGDAHRVDTLVRAMLRRVVLDLPQVQIAVLTERPHRWRALRWAPQHRHPTLADSSGAARLVAADPKMLGALLAAVPGPVLLVVDGPRVVPSGLTERATWVLRSETDARDPDLRIDADGVLRAEQLAGRALGCGTAELEAACRSAAAGQCHTAAVVRTADEPLRPVLGELNDGASTESGRPQADAVRLDIRESSQGGSGPHGMLIGVTGSGKSEVLRTIVAGLITTQPPSELALLLVDFKGGATFAPFADLRHAAGVITNLEADPTLVDRIRLALVAELRRRQHLLKSAGVAAYDELPAASTPRLVVIVDEFSELLAAHPDMIDVLVQIGRLGRSLGVHLLIAAQRLDEGRLKGLDTHLTYRIALRTQNGTESRAVIGTADAAALPNAPGYGYLRRGSSPPIAFRARFTGLATRPPNPEKPEVPALLRYSNGPLHTPNAPQSTTVLGAAIATAAAMPGERLPIWVPPPERSPTHADLYPDLRARPGRGYGTEQSRPTQVAIGIIDRPDRQRIEPAELDLATGHLALVGTTRSGTTTTAVAAVLSAALRNTPDELHLYLVEESPARFDALRRLPHVAGYAADADTTRSIVRRVAAIVAERAAGLPAEGPTIVLAIDGYARLRDAHDWLDDAVLAVAQRGLGVDVHLILTAHRWFDVRPRLRELFAHRVELRLGDPVESEIDRRAAALVPTGRPGRGLMSDGHPLYSANPDVNETAALIENAWAGPRARGLVELPPVLTIANLSNELIDRGICLAVERSTGRAVTLADVAPFCLVLGDAGSGRTSVLRSLGRQDAARETRLLVIDPRRRLLGALPAERELGYAATPAAVGELITGLVAGLDRRMPPADLTAQQWRERSWWSGPRLHLLVDDYDLLMLAGGSLAPLRRFLPYAADLGFRVTVARRVAGAGAALHDEVLSVLRDLGAHALLLSRAVDDGPVLGARPGPAPWGCGLLVAPARPTLDAQAIVEPP